LAKALARVGCFNPDQFLGGNRNQKEVAGGADAEQAAFQVKPLDLSQYAVHEHRMTTKDLAFLAFTR
jgi:hypothetical protein